MMGIIMAMLQKEVGQWIRASCSWCTILLKARWCLFRFFFFFFNDPAPTEIYPLPLHDALPISIVPSPASGWYTKWNPSEAVIIVPCPAPATVNVPFAKLALPATPTEPMSPSDQMVGRVGIKRKIGRAHV